MKQDNVQRKVGDFMGGKVLDLPEFKIYDQGKAAGKAEGRAEGEEERKELAQEIAQLKKRIKELEENQK